MHEIQLELAGVPFLLRCRSGANAAFFREYGTDKAPRFAIQPRSADLERLREALLRAEGGGPEAYGTAFLENNAIHALLSERLVGEGVLLIHGSALCLEGQAYLFTAKSGTGKSTHARLWRQRFGARVQMINDDKPLLRIEDSGVTVWGSPWNGKHHLSRNISAPLRALIRLRQAPENRLTPLPRAEAFSVLLDQALRTQEPETMRRILDLERRLLDAVPFYSLDCNTDPEAVQTVLDGITESERDARNGYTE